jgi:hypothetical protein
MSSFAPHRGRSALATGVAPVRLFGLAIVLFAGFAAAANAAMLPHYAYFSWNDSGGGLFAAQLGGVSGSMLFTTAGDDVLYGRSLTPTDSDFIAQFGSDVPSMFFENGPTDPTADALAQAAFTPALPAGARLLVVDVDQANAEERVQISRLGGSLSLLEQIESRAGATSAFPSWDPSTGVLQSVSSNEEEVSLFDVSGARALDLWYTRSIGRGGVSGSYFVIALPVPEPTGLSMATVWVAMFAAFGPALRRAPS